MFRRWLNFLPVRIAAGRRLLLVLFFLLVLLRIFLYCRLLFFRLFFSRFAVTTLRCAALTGRRIIVVLVYGGVIAVLHSVTAGRSAQPGSQRAGRLSGDTEPQHTGAKQ